MWRSFSFISRAISLCKTFGWPVTFSLRAWIFGQKGSIHLTNSAKHKWQWLLKKDKHINYFCYQQRSKPNVNIANSETNPGSVSKTFKQIPKISGSYLEKQRLILTKEPSISSILQLTLQFCTVSWTHSLSHLFVSQWIHISEFLDWSTRYLRENFHDYWPWIYVTNDFEESKFLETWSEFIFEFVHFQFLIVE